MALANLEQGVGRVVHNYRYEALTRQNQIRLLTLMPGKSDDLQLSFSMETTEIKLHGGFQTNYEALSYTWGDPAARYSASCSGSSFPLAVSLHDALSHLRYPDRTRTLWVDAICINQNDLDERASQVSMMQRIYHEAERVVVWLGAEDDLTSTAVGAFERLYAHVDAEAQWKSVHSSSGKQALDKVPSLLPQPERLTATEGVALARFFQRPWFKRVWVVQEVVSANLAHVVCGAHSIEWKRLAVVCQSDVLSKVARVSASMIRASPGILAVRRQQQLRESHSPVALLNLLASTRGLDATDPRDKLFAIQHLARETDPRPMVNYNTPTAEVYIQYAVACLKNHSLDFLSAVNPSGIRMRSRMSKLPSWVPDWSLKPDFTNYPSEHLPLLFSAHHFQASGSSKPNFALSVASGMLTLRGAKLDEIKTVGASGWASTAWNETFASLDFDFGVEMADMSTLSNTGQPDQFSLPREVRDLGNKDNQAQPWLLAESEEEKRWILLELLLCDTDASGDRIFPRRLRAPEIFLKAMASINPETQGMPHHPAFLQQPLYPSPLLSRIRAMSWGRRFCISSQGWIGWVPQAAQIGDVVVCFEGVKVLMLLRPQVKGRWSLVGECYLHGLMHGEVSVMTGLEWGGFVIV